MSALVKRFLPRDSLVERLVFFGGFFVALVAQGLYEIRFWAPLLPSPAALKEWAFYPDPRYFEFVVIMNPAGAAASAGLAGLFDGLDAPQIFVLVLVAVYVVSAYLWWLGIARACGLVAGLLRRSRSSQRD